MFVLLGKKKGLKIKTSKQAKISWPVAMKVAAGAILFTTAGIFFLQKMKNTSEQPPPPAAPSLYSINYPVAERFQSELQELTRTQKITGENQDLISQSVYRVARQLKEPQALLWCLFFQESRLDHLLGKEDPTSITGLGQFSRTAFFEINRDLDRYFSRPGKVVSELLGKDPRPIRADAVNLNALHSYYSIPTAVSSSALFLHNRWFQLRRVALAKNLSFSDEVLWMWAALAYNKGARGVFTLWQQIQKEQGKGALQAALTDPAQFRKVIDSQALIQRAFKRIWVPARASFFARELSLHGRNVTDCALSKTQENEKGDL